MEKGNIVEIRIEDMLDDGRAFGRYEGCAVFVSGGCEGAAGAVAGDTVNVRIGKVKKNSAEATLVSIVSPSPDRVPAECPYAAECGGCTMQELSYEAQKRIKTEQIRSKLQRIGGLDDPVVREMIGADTLKYYRNKAVFAVGPYGEVGFRKCKSHTVIDIDDCMLQTDAAMVCADALRHFLRETMSASSANPIKQMTVRTAFGTGEVMVILDTGDDRNDRPAANTGNSAKSGKNGKGGKNRKPGKDGKSGGRQGSADIRDLEKLVEMLDDAVYSLNIPEDNNAEDPVSVSTDTAVDGSGSTGTAADVSEAQPYGPQYSLESVAVIHNGKCRIAAGKPTITELFRMPDGRSLDFEISPQSFYQVNPEQMVKLYDKVAEYAGILSANMCAHESCSAKESVDFDSVNSCSDESDNSEESTSSRSDMCALTILDLYCGAGTIGLWLLEALRNSNEEAFEKARVIGIESVKPAVLDANRNSVINNIVGTRYICGRAEEELPGMMGLARLYKWNEVNERVEREPEIRIGHAGANASHEEEIFAETADIAILDPPRAGCDEALLDAVVKASPERIVYVSCDPGTLARDIKYLTANGYDFIEAAPVDQFVRTSSIEVAALLEHI